MTEVPHLDMRPVPNGFGLGTDTLVGVAPVRSSWPLHEADEIEAVAHVLRTGRVNALVHGDQNRNFAREFAQFTGARHAICVANGTVALELCLRALGIGPGDEVIVPARSFFASVSCVIAVGATPVFADIMPDSQNIDPASVIRMISLRTRAVLCVHLAGWPCDMKALTAICKDHDLYLVEDCAQAHGATFDGIPVGSFGDASAISFCTDKIMSTGGEGGMILLRDKELWQHAWAYKDHGKNPAKLEGPSSPPGEFRYVHDMAGSNFRMTEMQAAIGRCQLRKLPAWLAARRENAMRLRQNLRGHGVIRVPDPPDKFGHAWYKFYVQLTLRAADVCDLRAAIIARLHEQGIPCSSGSCPDMSREAALRGYSIRRDGDLPVARELGKRTLMFPVDHTLGLQDMDRISSVLWEILDT